MLKVGARLAMYGALLVLLAYFIFDSWRPSLLLVGNVTVDIVGNSAQPRRLPGGAVTYAAAVAKGLKEHACIVTTAQDPSDASALAGHDAHIMPTDATLTFRHTYTWFGNHRRLQVPQQPDHTLTAADVPLRCRLARVVLVGPLTATDVDVESFTRPASLFFRVISVFQHVGVMAQGLQRRLDKGGHVQHMAEPSTTLLSALTPATTVFLSDVETDPWTDEQFRGAVAQCRRLIITRGAKGVSAYAHDLPEVHVPAQKIKAVDTNGAGDTFATAYMVSMAHGKSVDGALVDATWMASRVCLREQECKPACCAAAVQEHAKHGQRPQPQAREPLAFLEASPRPDMAGDHAFV